MVSALLQDAVDGALHQMRIHPRHALQPYYRNAIYIAMPEPGETHSQYMRYAWLTIFTAQYVFPLWEQWCDHYRRDDKRAGHLLAKAERVLQGTDRVEDLRVEAEEAWSWFIDGKYITEDADVPPRPILSAFAAIAGAGLAVAELVIALDSGQLSAHDDMSRENELNPEDEDDSITDPWSADVALWGDDAISAPGMWSESEENSARLSYWTWWLTDAVPRAWTTATE